MIRMPERIFGKPGDGGTDHRWRNAALFVIVLTLIVAGMGGTILYQRSQILDDREQIATLRAERAAEKRSETIAANVDSVTGCLRAVTSVPDLVQALEGLEVVLQNQVDGASSALAQAVAGSLSPSRIESIKKTRRKAMAALAPTERLIEDTRSRKRTRKECEALARKLGVDINKLRVEASTR